MPNFIVSTTAKSNQVHDENSMCKHLPSPDHRRSLGWFSSSESAVAEARKTFSEADACVHCAKR
ncbi:MAG: hypothetical protein RIM99_18330 [Cyclobacteriaceae bacterium]